MRKPIGWLTLAFFVFLLWIIYLADTGSTALIQLVSQVPHGDKLGHLLLYGLLTLLLNLALELRTVSLGRLRLYFGTVAVTLFALCEELTQAWLPHRTLDAQDLLADALGIAVFSLLSRWGRPSRLPAA
ncbi:VanZ family protein [Marinobacter sp. SS21]|uniref:VanZ family protein n=1 Tax=Marinobacter sp. SS21 TaxID=2979460 RepID=UPI00232D42FB|nr:VanZ family protein [Marinobacter sp. SS21]MDC0661034.1 VanZ family protein [Marinobacter sp. SS21]